MLQNVFLMSLGEALDKEGWVHGLGSVMFGLAVQKFLNIDSLGSNVGLT